MQQPDGPTCEQLTGPPLTGCNAEIARIIEANQLRQVAEPDWQPNEIDNSCLVHHFIARERWPENGDKPFAAAFGNPGLSVVISGGTFPELTQNCIWRAIWHVRSSCGLDLVGAVAFEVGKVRELDYTVLHDPNPYYDKSSGLYIPQTENHAEIICKKQSGAKRERLREICSISLAPESFYKMGTLA